MSADFGVQVYEGVRKLRGFAIRWAGNPDSADDLMQDTIVKALRNQHRFDGRSLRGWLYVVMHNTARANARRPRRTTPLTDEMAEAIGHPYSHNVAEDRVHLQQVVAGMQPRGLDVIMDVTLRGLSYAETAQRHGIAVETVKSRILRTRRGEYRGSNFAYRNAEN